MRLNYDRPTIDAARAAAESLGHRIRGKFTRVPSGLSWENHCQACRAYVLVMPQWAPWHPGTYTGPAVNDVCIVYR